MNINSNNYTLVVDEKKFNEIIKYYEGYLVESNSEYIVCRAKLSLSTITFYKTLKILFQGQGSYSEYSKWINELNKTSESVYDIYQNESAIGTDECGTGDYFGPITCCATFIDQKNINRLREMGVKDSKTLTDERIKIIAKQLINLKIPYSIKILQPLKYNSISENPLFKNDNLNYIKSNLHNETINSLISKNEQIKKNLIIIDKFCSEKDFEKDLENKVKLYEKPILIEKGERAHLSVAASSILARYAFILEMEKLNKKYLMNFPKGSGDAADKAGIEFINKYSIDELKNVCKKKFKNTERIINK